MIKILFWIHYLRHRKEGEKGGFDYFQVKNFQELDMLNGLCMTFVISCLLKELRTTKATQAKAIQVEDCHCTAMILHCACSFFFFFF